MEPVIELAGLSVRFGKREILKNLTISLSGRIIGLLGPNFEAFRAYALDVPAKYAGAGLASSLAPALDPMARRVRRTPESWGTRLLKDLAYFGLVLAALPFTLAEAACHAGSTVMIEARKR